MSTDKKVIAWLIGITWGLTILALIKYVTNL